MYGTRKEINDKLKRAFTNDEPLAVLVWSRETVTDVFDEELTDAEVGHLMSRIGAVAFYGHAAEGSVALRRSQVTFCFLRCCLTMLLIRNAFKRLLLGVNYYCRYASTTLAALGLLLS